MKRILILSSTHPVHITELNLHIYKNYQQYNDIFSIQSMALLYEETLNKHYIPANYAFAQAVKKDPQLARSKINKGQNLIIFGNLDMATKIKLDHIIIYTNGLEENTLEDKYLQKMEELFDKTNEEKIINWYKTNDQTSRLIVPTLHHLDVFLETIGVKKNDNKI